MLSSQDFLRLDIYYYSCLGKTSSTLGEERTKYITQNWEKKKKEKEVAIECLV